MHSKKTEKANVTEPLLNDSLLLRHEKTTRCQSMPALHLYLQWHLPDQDHTKDNLLVPWLHSRLLLLQGLVKV
jgi:hypothetical protein